MFRARRCIPDENRYVEITLFRSYIRLEWRCRLRFALWSIKRSGFRVGNAVGNALPAYKARCVQERNAQHWL
jgi:hypothetical protein